MIQMLSNGKYLTFSVILWLSVRHICSQKRYAEQLSPETGVYFYQLSHIMKEFIAGHDLGVHHSADLDFVFGLSLVETNTTSDQNIRFTEEVMKLWTNFAKYGYELKNDFIFL